MPFVEPPAYRLAFQDRDGYLHCSISGDKDSFQTTLAAVTEVAEVCRSRQITKLLVEHSIAGRLSTMEIFGIAARLPELYRGVLVAFVVHQTEIPENPAFLETVARNRGAQGRLFRTVLEAEAWLVSV
jgi:uncharacterized iron-regulated protein